MKRRILIAAGAFVLGTLSCTDTATGPHARVGPIATSNHALASASACQYCIVDTAFTRAKGKPETHVIAFSADPTLSYTLDITNNGSQGSSATATLNGVAYVTADSFATNPAFHLRVTVRLASSDTLVVTLTGRPGSTLAIQVISPLLYADDFSGDLSHWVHEGGGTWIIQDGHLVGEYDISCGSSGCAQSQLLLVDALQPTVPNWRAEVQFTQVAYPYSPSYNLTWSWAWFALWVSDAEKTQVGAGMEAFNVPMPATLDSIEWWRYEYPWHSVAFGNVTAPTWTPTLWNTVALEKIGDQYTLYFNGQQLYSFTGSFSQAPKIGFNVYGKCELDNFRLLAL